MAQDEKARVGVTMKVLVTIWKNDVAPRFDLASEVLIAFLDDEGNISSKKTLVLPTVSADELCHLIISENIDEVICGGIENEYFEYLNWKKIKVIDSVIGPYEKALELAGRGELKEGVVFFRNG